MTARCLTPWRSDPSHSASTTCRDRPAPVWRWGRFVYVRFHGEATKYAGGYPSHTLRGWADWLAEMIWTGKDIYGYFNNDVGGHSPRDALTLHRYLSTLTARAS